MPAPPVVFVLDDDATVLRSLEFLICSAGWRAETFASAREFLSRPPAEGPSCLVLDLALPDLNGLDVQALLVDRREMPVIFITGHADVATTVRAMKAGAVDFLTKPYDAEALLFAVRHALERSTAAIARRDQLRYLHGCYASLSRREREVLDLVVDGRLNKQVGGELGISEITVKAHRGHLMRKMQARSVADLVTKVLTMRVNDHDRSFSPPQRGEGSHRYVRPMAFGGNSLHIARTMKEMDRRHFLGVAAAAVAASSRRLDAMTQMLTPAQTGIRPFRVNFSGEDVADLRRRVKATKWPERETVNDASQGVQSATMQKLAKYWASDYDWSKCEAKLKALPHFVTEIDGLDIHFIHVKSKHPNALPLIVTHGWPGSIIEQLKIIEPLTDPTAHGGNASDAFDVVIPSLPGYGFSAKTTAPGWDVPRIARAWITLMKRLGYTRFVAQGGDWGNAVSEVMALIAPPELLAISTNMAATVPAEISKAMAAGGPPPADLTADEVYAWKQLDDFYKNGLAYANEMGLRPQTLFAIADSPVGLAAWILDHDIRSYKLIARVFDGAAEGLTRDDILDNITFYWLTNTAVSSARLYWEARQTPSKGGFFDVRGVKIPVSVTVFPDEIYAAPRTWAERAYPNLLYYKRHDKGTHFAAWEQPALLTADLRESFRSLR